MRFEEVYDRWSEHRLTQQEAAERGGAGAPFSLIRARCARLAPPLQFATVESVARNRLAGRWHKPGCYHALVLPTSQMLCRISLRNSSVN